jgi:hypothetical protein
MKKVGIWLADSPLGGMFKAGLGAVLVYVLDNVASFNLDPILIVALGAALPVAINYINGADTRYGKIN